MPARYNVILFLTIHDPEEEVKTKVSVAALEEWHTSNWGVSGFIVCASCYEEAAFWYVVVSLSCYPST